MPRTIYLIVYNSPLFPAHWALWIPSLENPNIGKRIHAEGDVATGFQLSFDRNYDQTQESRSYKVLVLAEVESHHVVDTPANEINSVDRDPKDDIETVASRVPIPGPSLTSSAARTARGTKVDIKNCQAWLVDVVDALHREGIFDSNAVEVIKMAPKN
ncbi:hypothetical protein HD806DRAFT_490608 [Xylariaceae sp. AK1471]|nr:hypothetical protein HD806DRAFT_490608 [Xylariaceae sp. AK1471]